MGSVEAMVAAQRRRTDAAPPQRQDPDSGRRVSDAVVTVRFATPADAPALERLAALDNGSVPVGTTLVAELDGELVAALSVRFGRTLADPFRPAAELVRLLELRRAQLRGRDRRGRRRAAYRRAGTSRASSAKYG
jgi:hypothetical protein